MELVMDYYESYKAEAKYEFGDKVKVMTFEEFCKFYEVDETISEERILEIFAFWYWQKRRADDIINISKGRNKKNEDF